MDTDLQASMGINVTPVVPYDDYDYSAFWENRAYENAADKIAVRRLLKKLPVRFFGYKLIDIGSGSGRLTHTYENFAERITLLDPSFYQLKHAKSTLAYSKKYRFITGVIESMPFQSGSFDLAISVRLFHYVVNSRQAIKEVARVLAPGGYFIIEIPNKIHMKARIKGFFSKNNVTSHESISQSVHDPGVPFLNHHPVAIRNILSAESFEVVDVLSVSNFRNPFLKKVVPIGVLLFLERILQRPLAALWFGPSIYFLARKKDTDI